MNEEIRAALGGAATIVLADGPDGADIVPAALAASGPIGARSRGGCPATAAGSPTSTAPTR